MSESIKAQFVQYVTDEPPAGTIEFRFIGDFGFGGKFYVANGKAYIECYPEDDTPERTARKTEINRQIKAIITDDRNVLFC